MGTENSEFYFADENSLEIWEDKQIPWINHFDLFPDFNSSLDVFEMFGFN